MTQPDSLVISQVHALARAAAAPVFFSRVAQVEQLLRLHGFHRAVAGLKLDMDQLRCLVQVSQLFLCFICIQK